MSEFELIARHFARLGAERGALHRGARVARHDLEQSAVVRGVEGRRAAGQQREDARRIVLAARIRSQDRAPADPRCQARGADPAAAALPCRAERAAELCGQLPRSPLLQADPREHRRARRPLHAEQGGLRLEGLHDVPEESDSELPRLHVVQQELRRACERVQVVTVDYHARSSDAMQPGCGCRKRPAMQGPQSASPAPAYWTVLRDRRTLLAWQRSRF